MRLLDKDKLMLDMTKLGFEPESLKKLEVAIAKPWGMVLVTGPTGSGKTNTLYSSIAKINTTETNIMTAEDPVEFNLVGVNQVQVRENIGLNFAAALRSFLRQDPNIILVGEIRDFETAEIAVKAALTGHLVLSTLHTNDAPSTINRLDEHGHRAVPGRELGQPHLRAAPRAPHLRQLQDRRAARGRRRSSRPGFTPDEAQTVIPKKGSGCEKCNNTGYKGRVGLYEVMEIARGAARADPGRRVGPRAAAQGGRGRHDHAAPQRPAQGHGRRHDDRRSRARDGEVDCADRCRRLPLMIADWRLRTWRRLHCEAGSWELEADDGDIT